MYREEEIINGVLYFRTHPDAHFQPCSLERVTEALLMERLNVLERISIAKIDATMKEKLRIAEIPGLTGVLAL